MNKMQILIVLAHPDKKSFNHAIANVCSEKLASIGHSIILHDLYAEGFNPLLETSEIPKNAQIDKVILQHCNDLVSSDAIIIVHPNWWGQPPAILKGWIDRVIRPGVAYEFQDDDKGEGVPIGLLKAKTAIVFNTSNTSAEREDQVFKDPLETIWRNCIFDLCGVKEFHRRMFRIVVTSDLDQRKQWLSEVDQIINDLLK